MNWIDILILVVLCVGAVSGFRRGFIVEVAIILGAAVALAVARLEYRPLQALLHPYIGASAWSTVIAYLLIFLVVWSLVRVLARLARRGARLLMLGPADRLGGVVVGLLQAALLLEVLLYLAKRLHGTGLGTAIRVSRLTPLFLDFIPYLNRLFPHIPR